MDSDARTNLEDRYERTTSAIREVGEERRQLVMEKTQDFSAAHEDINGSFGTDSLRRPEDRPTIGLLARSDDEAVEEVFVQVETTDEYEQLTQELERLKKELDEIWQLAAEIIVDNDLNKKENIGRLWASFGMEASNQRIAEAVNCHPQYPGQLTYVPESDTAEYKDWVQSRKDSQVDEALRREILERDCRACVRCGVEEDLLVHHIKPVKDGGSNAAENLATLCKECHSAVHDERGAGAVIYKTQNGFWNWVRDGQRGFDPSQTQSSLSEFE